MRMQMQWRKYLAGGLWLLSRTGKFWILLLLVGVCGLEAFTHIPTQLGSRSFELDHSWFLDLGYQWQQGHLLGRDAFFTYGPLAQVLVSIAAFLQGSGSILTALSLGYFLFNSVALVLLALCLGLIKQLRWTGALFI